VSQGSSGGTTGRMNAIARSLRSRRYRGGRGYKFIREQVTGTTYSQHILRYCTLTSWTWARCAVHIQGCISATEPWLSVAPKYWEGIVAVTASPGLPSQRTSNRNAVAQRTARDRNHAATVSIRQPWPTATLGSSGYGGLLP
jgi:hypothetical protein